MARGSSGRLEWGDQSFTKHINQGSAFSFEGGAWIILDFCDTGFAEIRKGRGDFQHLLPRRFYGREVVGFNVYFNVGQCAADQRGN